MEPLFFYEPEKLEVEKERFSLLYSDLYKCLCTATIHEIDLILKGREGNPHGLQVVDRPHCLWQKSLIQAFFFLLWTCSISLFILIITGFIVVDNNKMNAVHTNK